MGAFSADNSIEEARFDHQDGRCALCGKEIVFENCDEGDRGSWHAHHIDGDFENNSLRNCTCVCINKPQKCHLYIAHDGSYAHGALAPRKWFRLEGWDDKELDDILECKNPEDIRQWHETND